MSKKRIVTLLYVLGPVAVYSHGHCLRQDKPVTEVQWRTNYNAARREALEKKRPILILIENENSLFCTKFKSVTLGNSDVVRLINAELIPLSREFHRDSMLSQFLRVEGFPTTVIATHNGQIISQKIGYVAPAAFRDYLHSILAECYPPDRRTNSLPRRTSCYPR